MIIYICEPFFHQVNLELFKLSNKIIDKVLYSKSLNKIKLCIQFMI